MLQPMVQNAPKQKALPFTTLTTIGANGESWRISSMFHTDEMLYYFVERILDWKEATGDDTEVKYHGTMHVVSPDYAGIHNLRQAFKSNGYDDPRYTKHYVIEALCGYGVSATLAQYGSNNYRDVQRILQRETHAARGLFGFYLDRQQNRAGNSGWDFLRGDLFPPRKEDVQRRSRDAAEWIVCCALAGLRVEYDRDDEWGEPPSPWSCREDAPADGGEGYAPADESYYQLMYVARVAIREWFYHLPK